MSQRVPEFTAKYKVFSDLSASTEVPVNYTELFSFDNTCSLEQAQIKFDNEGLDLKIVIDDFTILEVNIDDLMNFEGSGPVAPGIWWDSINNLFYFIPSSPIQVKQYVKIYARATNFSWWGSNVNYKGHIVTLQHWS